MINLCTIAIVAVLLFGAAHASQSCLDQDQAAPTWPFRQLTTDADGCWTYRKVPLPVERPQESGTSDRQWTADVEKEMKILEPGVPLMDRWPAETPMPRPHPIKRGIDNGATTTFLIFSVVILSAAVCTVLFGGRKRGPF